MAGGGQQGEHVPGEQPAKQRDRLSPKVDISFGFCFTPCPPLFYLVSHCS